MGRPPRRRRPIERRWLVKSMHEMALMRDVVDIVLKECEGKGVRSVKAVYLTIGEMRDVIDEYVPSLFEYLARGTIAEHAKVVIRHTPTLVRCEGIDARHPCGNIFPIDVHDSKTWECPRCHAYQRYSLFSGGEFRIDRIEVKNHTNEGTADVNDENVHRQPLLAETA